MIALNEHYSAQTRKVQADHADDTPEWLIARRQKAAARFATAGFPDPRHEEWKYTNVRPIATRPLVLASENGTVSADDVESLTLSGQEVHRVVLVDGVFKPEFSILEGLPASTVTGLAEAIVHSPERLEPLFGTVAHDRFSSFVAANMAFATDGVVIDLEANQVLDRPIYLLFISTVADQPFWCHPRVLVRAAAGSSATIIEHYQDREGANGCTNVVTEIQAGEGARISHYLLQEHAETAYHLGSVFVHQTRDSDVQSFNINLGGRLARHDINVDLADTGAAIALNGLFLVGGRQHADTHTRVHHAAPHTTSREQYRGIAQGHGRGVFKGRVLVEEGAQKTDAQQHSANLLLSPTAEIDTKPELEIYADDVKCAHGATVGQLDETSLYYLRSRGISAEAARGMLVFAFADEVLESMALTAVRESIEQRLAGRLPETVREGM